MAPVTSPGKHHFNIIILPAACHIFFIDFVLRSSSTQAEAINRLHVYFLGAAGFILFIVIAATVFIVYKFRSREGQPYQPKTLSRKWEIAMLGVPLALVVVFFFLMLRTMQQVAPPVAGNTPDVIITGHQYWWEAQYPAQQVTTANEIHLPVGRKLLLKLVSADVIHDWWVPQFGNKMDLISGRDNFLWLQITAPGKYRGACSEFCGAQHAGMFINVIAEPEDKFDDWIKAHQQLPAAAANPLVQKGAQLFQLKTCGSCHAISGTAARGRAGPDLTHLASRQTLLTGLLQNNKESLSQWLQHPQQIKPGANMPKFFLDKPSLDALVAYLASLK